MYEFTHPIHIDTISSHSEFGQYWQSSLTNFALRQKSESSIVNELRRNVKYDGYQILENKKTAFKIPLTNRVAEEHINFRESVICNNKLSSRMRSSIAIFLELTKNKNLHNQKVYLTEQVTPLYKYFGHIIPENNLYGSEYISSEMKSGEVKNGIRHEDMTALSFSDSSLDAIVCLEVLEHIPDYKAALREAYRVLNNDGTIVISAPFSANRKETLIRATIDNNGHIIHHQEPEYHGDPMLKEGILCFQHFGWDVLEYMKEIGFKEVKLITTWSKEYGILGYFEPQWYGIK